MSNNVTKNLITTDSGWVNKQDSENKIITEIPINLGNINKGINKGDMENKILVNIGNSVEINKGLLLGTRTAPAAPTAKAPQGMPDLDLSKLLSSFTNTNALGQRQIV